MKIAQWLGQVDVLVVSTNRVEVRIKESDVYHRSDVDADIVLAVRLTGKKLSELASFAEEIKVAFDEITEVLRLLHPSKEVELLPAIVQGENIRCIARIWRESR